MNGTQIKFERHPEFTGRINYDHMQQSMEMQASYESPINVGIDPSQGGTMSPANISCLNDCPITTGVDLLDMEFKSVYLSTNMWVIFDSRTDTKDFYTNMISNKYERTVLTIHFEARFEPKGAQMFRTGIGFETDRNYFRYQYYDGNGYRYVYGSIPSTKPNYPGANYWWNDF